jgi:hypothetical protein
MGLDTTHNCWHGPYSSFNTWRIAVARAALDIDLDQMAGFGGKQLSWAPFRRDPIALLLNHSDCDGSLRWQDCAAIADRLEESLPGIRALDGGPAWVDGETYLVAKTLQFIAGLRDAAEAREDVEFH